MLNSGQKYPNIRCGTDFFLHQHLRRHVVSYVHNFTLLHLATLGVYVTDKEEELDVAVVHKPEPTKVSDRPLVKGAGTSLGSGYECIVDSGCVDIS